MLANGLVREYDKMSCVPQLKSIWPKLTRKVNLKCE